MASLAPSRLASGPTSSRSPTPSAHQSNNRNPSVYRHQHSLSSSTLGTQQFGSLLSHHGGPRSAGGPRQSLDVTKMLAVNGPISPRPPLTGLRPTSEVLCGGGSAGANSGDPSIEAEAIDKWFEDLQSYEATLEEMAAASLDVNFKEELNAIEQWFRVLSEAERTAALYSLMQSLNQVQIRFFITVLQQMARSDPMISLLSPAFNPGSQSMEQQMEAKLSQLSLKSPASPVVRQFANQSLGSNLNVASNESFLSPNSALFHESNHVNEAANLLSAQRAKLNAKSANRVSAPGQLLGANTSLKSPRWGNVPGPVEEEAQSGSSSPKPKNINGDLSISQSSLHPTITRTPNVSSFLGIESQLSPIMGGSWASQVNTPLVPMFSNKDSSVDSATQNAADTSSRLAQWGVAHQSGSNSVSLSASTLSSSKQNTSTSLSNGFPLDDARKFRRQSKSTSSNPVTGTFLGGPPGLDSNNSTAVNQTSSSNPVSTHQGQSTTQGRHANPTFTPRSAMSNPTSLPSPLHAQQAAVAAQQNWRNGRSNTSMSPGNNADPSIFNNLAVMNSLAAGLHGGMNVNGMANLAAMANMTDPAALQNMANLLNVRQHIQQVHNLQTLQQQLQHSGLMNNGSLLSPASARFGMNFAFPMAAGSPTGSPAKRSPGARGTGKPSHTPGSGSNPNEELDMKLLNDIPAWLRGLRLHKYTPNFAGCTWQEMVLMSDATLEARGVAAVGARRKMLRTFETVRIIKGMALPGDGTPKPSTPTNNCGVAGVDANVKPTTNIAPPTESDRDTNKS